jgi:transketolase
MRAAFVQTLVELGERDRRVLLLTADLGFMALEPFAERNPKQFLNVGVAEQNMVGVACGLAEAGFLPFVYSIATFASMRGYEFIRNGPILHELPVRIVGVGGGFEYGTAGPTHHALEDVGLMRMHSQLTVIAPADHQQTRNALLATWQLPGPVYYRLGKDDKTIVPGLDGRFEMGRVALIGQGSDLLILSMGSVSVEAAAAVEMLAAKGLNCTLGIVACVNPAPVTDLIEMLSRFPVAITVEAHYVSGGLGSLVSEVIADHGISCTVVRCGVSSQTSGLTGSQAYLHRVHGLDRESLVATALKTVSGTLA